MDPKTLFLVFLSVIAMYFLTRKMTLRNQEKKIAVVLEGIGRCRAGGEAVIGGEKVYDVEEEFDSGMAAMKFLEEEMQARSREASFGKIIFCISDREGRIEMRGGFFYDSFPNQTWIDLKLWVDPIKQH